MRSRGRRSAYKVLGPPKSTLDPLFFQGQMTCQSRACKPWTEKLDELDVRLLCLAFLAPWVRRWLAQLSNMQLDKHRWPRAMAKLDGAEAGRAASLSRTIVPSKRLPPRGPTETPDALTPHAASDARWCPCRLDRAWRRWGAHDH